MIEFEKVEEDELTDKEFLNLEEKFNEVITSSKSVKNLGKSKTITSIPESIKFEENDEISTYANTYIEEVEPNDTMSRADRISVNDYMQGTIEDRYDIDYFKIKFSTSGQAYFRLVVPEDVDYDMYVLSSTGNEIEMGDSGLAGETERLYSFVTPNMYYYIRIEGCGRNDYDSKNQYTLRVKLYEDEEEYAFCVGVDFADEDGLDDDNINTIPAAEKAHEVLERMGYNSTLSILPNYYLLEGQNPDGTERLGSSVVFLDGHGAYDHVRFHTSDLEYTDHANYNTGVSTKYDSYDGDGFLGKARFATLKDRDISNSRLMIFAACETANEDGGGRNIADYAQRRGVETTIGWRNKINDVDMKNWCTEFFNNLRSGYSVLDAAIESGDFAPSTSKINNWTIYGNEDNVINLSGPKSRNVLKKLSDESDMMDFNDEVSVESIEGTDNMDLSSLNKFIEDNYNYFVPEDYNITIEKINDVYTKIYYEKYINGFNTNSGFNVVIKNGELYYLKEKPLENEDLITRKFVNVTDDMINEAKKVAANEVPSEYEIINQNVDKLIIDSEYYLVVNSEYTVSSGSAMETYGCEVYNYKIS